MLNNIVLAAVPIKTKEDVKEDKGNDLTYYQCKPSDLPIYTTLHSLNKPKMAHSQKPSALHETIENGIGIVRSEIQSALRNVSKQKDDLNEYINTAKLHTQSTIDYLNEPHNILPRTGAIALGGLAGFIFGARGGIIKKFLYTSISAGAVASLCYPRQAESFAQDALYQTRKGYAIAYNFIKGTKPGEKMTVEPINKFPTSLEDVKFLVYDLYDEAKEALFPKKE